MIKDIYAITRLLTFTYKNEGSKGEHKRYNDMHSFKNNFFKETYQKYVSTYIATRVRGKNRQILYYRAKKSDLII